MNVQPSGLLPPAAAAIRRALLRWYRCHARSLPWRHANSFYPVWVSEVMLQQTQVGTVIPYYRRFLRHFPTIRHLAAAPLERVLELWSGLGYYSRARSLHQAAQVICDRFGGRFPRDLAAARSLPGVGEYTARAILSIAYNLPYAVLDGNVARVMARLAGLRGSLQETSLRRTAQRDLASILSKRNPGVFNQALMELGQTICLPRGPRCPKCCVRSWCTAYRLGRPESFPQPRRRRPAERHCLAVAVLTKPSGEVALVRGLAQGLLEDLWNFPSAFGKTVADARRQLQRRLAALSNHTPRLGPCMARLRHGITYRSIDVRIYSAMLASDVRLRKVRWFPIHRLGDRAVSQLTRKICHSLKPGHSPPATPPR